jgi:hypothetical protein
MPQIPQLMNGVRLQHDIVSDYQFVSKSVGNYVTLFSDFIQDVGETAVLPWVYTEVSSSGNVTGDFIDAPDGVFRLAHTADNEVQAALLSLGGTNAISPTKGPVMEARVKITLASGAAFDAASVYEVIVGMCTAGTAANAGAGYFDGIVDNVGFRLGGGTLGNNSILCESDDGTTDTAPNDSGIDFTSGTYHIYKIDMTDLSNVLFFVDGVNANNGKTFDISVMAAGDYLEPWIQMARTNTAASPDLAHTMDIDYVNVTWQRS